MEKTRNGRTWTEAQFWAHLRSSLRRAYRYWKPIQQCKLDARRPNQSDNKRMKWEYQCNSCKEWFPDREVQIDHIIPCGSLKCWDDVVPFMQRLVTEDGFQCLCKPCHAAKTKEERGGVERTTEEGDR